MSASEAAGRKDYLSYTTKELAREMLDYLLTVQMMDNNFDRFIKVIQLAKACYQDPQKIENHTGWFNKLVATAAKFAYTQTRERGPEFDSLATVANTNNEQAVLEQLKFFLTSDKPTDQAFERASNKILTLLIMLRTLEHLFSVSHRRKMELDDKKDIASSISTHLKSSHSLQTHFCDAIDIRINQLIKIEQTRLKKIKEAENIGKVSKPKQRQIVIKRYNPDEDENKLGANEFKDRLTAVSEKLKQRDNPGKLVIPEAEKIPDGDFSRRKLAIANVVASTRKRWRMENELRVGEGEFHRRQENIEHLFKSRSTNVKTSSSTAASSSTDIIRSTSSKLQLPLAIPAKVRESHLKFLGISASKDKLDNKGGNQACSSQSSDSPLIKTISIDKDDKSANLKAPRAKRFEKSANQLLSGLRFHKHEPAKQPTRDALGSDKVASPK